MFLFLFHIEVILKSETHISRCSNITVERLFIGFQIFPEVQSSGVRRLPRFIQISLVITVVHMPGCVFTLVKRKERYVDASPFIGKNKFVTKICSKHLLLREHVRVLTRPALIWKNTMNWNCSTHENMKRTKWNDSYKEIVTNKKISKDIKLKNLKGSVNHKSFIDKKFCSQIWILGLLDVMKIACPQNITIFPWMLLNEMKLNM